MLFVPTKIFFTKGVGRHKEYLSSFELALRDAKIEKCNLVTVSSIYPPGCKRITVDEGTKLLLPGAVTFAVMARNATNEPNRLVTRSRLMTDSPSTEPSAVRSTTTSDGAPRSSLTGRSAPALGTLRFAMPDSLPRSPFP